MKNRTSGFTLIELMITVLVAAILMAMAAPAFTNFIVSSRLIDQTNEIIGNLNSARSEAIKRNRSVQFCRVASATDTACATGDAPWAFWVIRDTGTSGTIIRRGTIPTYGATLSVNSSLANEIVTFGPDGLAQNGGVLVNSDDLNSQFFEICSSRMSTENKRSLLLGAGSRVSVVKGDGAC